MQLKPKLTSCGALLPGTWGDVVVPFRFTDTCSTMLRVVSATAGRPSLMYSALRAF